MDSQGNVQVLDNTETTRHILLGFRYIDINHFSISKGIENAIEMHFKKKQLGDINPLRFHMTSCPPYSAIHVKV